MSDGSSQSPLQPRTLPEIGHINLHFTWKTEPTRRHRCCSPIPREGNLLVRRNMVRLPGTSRKASRELACHLVTLVLSLSSCVAGVWDAHQTNLHSLARRSDLPSASRPTSLSLGFETLGKACTVHTTSVVSTTGAAIAVVKRTQAMIVLKSCIVLNLLK